MRFFVAAALQKAAPASQVVLATPVTAGCRMIKSPAEIACLQYANDITLAAFKAGLATLREGMTQGELGGNITAAYRQMGASGAIAVSFGEYTAFPHGSIEPQRLKDGRRRPDRRRRELGGLPVRHHADDRLRQADRAPDRGLEPREEGAGRGVCRREDRRDLRVGRRRRAQGDHRRRLRSRLQGARASPPHRPRHRHGRPRVDELRERATRRSSSRACASATSR